MRMRSFMGAVAVSVFLTAYGDGYISLNIVKSNESYRQAYLMRMSAMPSNIAISYKPTKDSTRNILWRQLASIKIAQISLLLPEEYFLKKQIKTVM